MSTQAESAAQAQAEGSGLGSRRFAALSDDLALKIFVAVATTVVLGRLGFDPTAALLGAAISPVFAELIQTAVERRGLKRRHLLLATLFLFLVHGAERALAAAKRRPRPPRRPAPEAITVARRVLLLTGAVASAVTVAGFTAAEAVSGQSLVADRPLTFFHDDGPLPPDVIAPRLTLPANLVVESSGPRPVWYAVSAVDSRDGDLEPTCAPEPGSRFPIGKTRVRCSVADESGNRSAGAFAVTLVQPDAGEHTITMRFPERVVVEATGPDGAVAEFVVGAADPEGEPLTPECSPRSSSRFPIGRTIVICTARAAAESATRRFPVVVADTTSPRLSLPADIRAEAGPDGRAVAYGAVTATDRVDGSIEPSCEPRSGSRFAVGTTLVRCSARDAHGNEARGRFAVTLVSVDDTTPPELELPGDHSAEAASAAGALVRYEAGAHDNLDDAPSVTCTPPSGTVFAIGPTRVDCTAVDRSGNRDTGSFVVTVSDTTGPVIELSGGTAEATSASGARVGYRVTARDAVDGALDGVTCSPEAGSRFPLGDTTVACRAADRRGNVTAASFTVTVGDTTGPKVYPPGDRTAEASSRAGARVRYGAAKAVDAVDGAVPATCSPSSGSTFRLGQTTITCSATDRRGNRGEASFRITVSDTTAPTLEIPNQIRYIDSGSGTEVTYPPAIDAVDGKIVPTCRPPSGSFFPARKRTTVRCYAMDRSGNRSPSISFTVWVEYTPE